MYQEYIAKLVSAVACMPKWQQLQVKPFEIESATGRIPLAFLQMPCYQSYAFLLAGEAGEEQKNDKVPAFQPDPTGGRFPLYSLPEPKKGTYDREYHSKIIAINVVANRFGISAVATADLSSEEYFMSDANPYVGYRPLSELRGWKGGIPRMFFDMFCYFSP